MPVYRNYTGRSALLACWLLTFHVAGEMKAQDSSNVEDYSDKFLLRIYTVTKSNSLQIENSESMKSLDLLPNETTSLGVGFNYKRIGIGIAFGLPRSATRDRKYGKTQRLDIQGSMYGEKLGADGYLQAYKGYYNSNPTDFLDWTDEALPQLAQMRILSAGFTAFYVFNSDEYSYRSAFVRDQVQHKSTGSFLLGMFGNFDEARTDTGFIPEEFPDSLRTTIDVKEFKNLAVGVSIGYAYNLILRKKFILGLAVLPGFGYQKVSFVALNGTIKDEDQPAGQLLTRLALGYEHRSFFLGLTGSVNLRSIDLNPYKFKLATEQFRVILGKRFDM